MFRIYRCALALLLAIPPHVAKAADTSANASQAFQERIAQMIEVRSRAYRFAASHFLTESSDDFDDLEWLAGYIALTLGIGIARFQRREFS